MTNEEIKRLSPILNHFATLKNTSKDITNNTYMTNSTLNVVDFDKVPKEYARGKDWPGVPKSNDALFIDGDKWTFIEFKNGSIDKCEIFRKIYDSVIMLLESGAVRDFEFVRQKIAYILVYSGEKIQKWNYSDSRNSIYKHTSSLAKKEIVLFELDKLIGYLLSEVHTYTQEDFEVKFVKTIQCERALGVPR